MEVNIAPSISMTADSLEMYLPDGTKILLSGNDRFKKTIKHHQSFYTDSETGVQYFKGKNNYFGYTDQQDNFYYANKQGLTFKQMKGTSTIYVIDELKRNVMPSTFGVKSERVYVRDNGF